MNKYKLALILFFLFDLVLFITAFTSLVIKSGGHWAILNPQGMIAEKELNLMLLALIMGFTVVIPVFLLAIFVGFRYREGKSSKYEPEWSGDGKLQAFWWVFPTLVIFTLAGITWVYTHTLDPRNAIASPTKEMTVQVVALQWKWLFIYPEEHIATVNYLVIPEKTPINFELTGDEAPMNSFWVPQLGGQIYAMTGMSTQTHLIADKTGEFRGSSAEISGQGFAGMDFKVKSVSESDYTNWVNAVKLSPKVLDATTYKKLVQPSEHNQPTYYSSTDSNLYTTIVMKYMSPQMKKFQETKTDKMEGMGNMQGMQ